MRSLGLRLVGFALASALIGLALVGIVIALLLRDFVVETYEDNLDATLVALMASTEFVEATSQVRVNAAVADPRYEQPFSGWYWQIGEDETVLIRSGSLWSGAIALDGGTMLESGARRSFASGPQDERLRVLSRRFTGPGSTVPLRVAAAMPEAEISVRVVSILVPLVVSLALVAAVLVAGSLVQVRFGLAPLKRLSANLRKIRRGHAHGLPPEPTRELAPVVAETNALIAANRETLQRARTHVGNLAHGLKTPLAVLGTELEDASLDTRKRVRLEALAARMDRMVSHHLRRARTAGSVDTIGVRTDVATTLAELLPVFKGIYADKGVVITTTCPSGLVFAGEREDLDELLGNLIDNACKWARGTVTIVAYAQLEQRFALAICDDGPGMTAEEAEAALGWGKRFDEGRPGAGLGLAIVSDLARLYGGALRFSPRNDGQGGAMAVLSLPAAESTGDA